MTKTAKAIDFEQQLKNLEELVATLESGDLSLEDSMKSFEQGIKVARECQQALKEAEQKVEILLNDSKTEVFAPLDNDSD